MLGVAIPGEIQFGLLRIRQKERTYRWMYGRADICEFGHMERDYCTPTQFNYLPASSGFKIPPFQPLPPIYRGWGENYYSKPFLNHMPSLTHSTTLVS